MRRESSAARRRTILRSQREVLRDVMLSAGECESWLTLEELAKLTHYPPASISAQLRHLRKPQYGAYRVEKRQRDADHLLRGEESGPLWEYCLRHESASRLEARS
jgi:hypothetical protein